MENFDTDDYAFAKEMAEKLESTPLESWLYEISNYCNAEKNKYFYSGDKLFFKNIDKLLQTASYSLQNDQDHMENKEVSNTTMIIGSMFASTGGHSRLARDIHKIEGNSIIIITDIFDSLKSSEALQQLKEFFNSENIFSCPYHGLSATYLWLINSIKNIKPRKIYILNHPQDPIPILAINAKYSSEIIYVHHLDFAPGLGASIEDFKHFDITNCTHEACKVNIRHANTLPLVGPTDEIIETSVKPHSPYETISIGGELKYNPGGSYCYEDLIIDLLSNNIKKHHHFGNLSQERVRSINEKLISHGIDSNAFIYYGNVPELEKFIIGIDNPIYITSFPLNGGLSTIHAMSFGIPIISYSEKHKNKNLINLAPLENYPNPSLNWHDSTTFICALNECINNYYYYSHQTKEKYLSKHTPRKFSEKLFEHTLISQTQKY